MTINPSEIEVKILNFAKMLGPHLDQLHNLNWEGDRRTQLGSIHCCSCAFTGEKWEFKKVNMIPTKSEQIRKARYVIYIYIIYLYYRTYKTDSKTTILSITYFGTDPWSQASPGSLSLEGLFPSDHIVNLAFCVIRHFFETLTSLTN